MAAELGTGDHRYQEQSDWGHLPKGWSYREVPDVAVDRRDRVHVLSRGEHPVIVFEADGTFVGTWGEGMFRRPHGLTLGADDCLWCVDDAGHAVYKCNLEGKVLLALETPGQPAPAQSGRPFNLPTKVAVHPRTGEVYVSDGYGNARVHKYSAEGRHLLSWGDYGVDPGQFNLPHSLCTDAAGRVYVADRESHRVQVFDEHGRYLTQWNNLHRPCGIHIHGDRAYVGQLLTHLAVNEAYPNLGACVTVHDLTGSQLARLGGRRPGEGPGQFTTPHGLAVDSRGDLYVGEVSWSAYGSRLSPPRQARCLRKLVRL
ncbi:MAG: peptidyl-alpha-hydroxyglycine alpha-amidating lyase family protein [Candidatus Latescibacterota bacterium]